MPNFCECGADTYICQKCGRILCSKDHPSSWRPDITGISSAGNVCPDCLGNRSGFRLKEEPETTISDEEYLSHLHSLYPEEKKAREGRLIESEWTKEEILEKLDSSNNWVERGIIAIFQKQTEDEKSIETTRHFNKVGFSAFHAKTGTYYAKWLLNGRHLTGKHLEKGRELIKHYAGQLANIANQA